MISARDFVLHLGHVAFVAGRVAQFERFSDADIVNIPPSPFAPENTCSSESSSHLIVSGLLEHIVCSPPCTAPAIPSRPGFLKNDGSSARGSFM